MKTLRAAQGRQCADERARRTGASRRTTAAAANRAPWRSRRPDIADPGALPQGSRRCDRRAKLIARSGHPGRGQGADFLSVLPAGPEALQRRCRNSTPITSSSKSRATCSARIGCASYVGARTRGASSASGLRVSRGQRPPQSRQPQPGQREQIHRAASAGVPRFDDRQCRRGGRRVPGRIRAEQRIREGARGNGGPAILTRRPQNSGPARRDRVRAAARRAGGGVVGAPADGGELCRPEWRRRPASTWAQRAPPSPPSQSG